MGACVCVCVCVCVRSCVPDRVVILPLGRPSSGIHCLGASVGVLGPGALCTYVHTEAVGCEGWGTSVHASIGRPNVLSELRAGSVLISDPISQREVLVDT